MENLKVCFVRMPSEMLQTEIQPLLTKVVGALAFGLQYLFWRFRVLLGNEVVWGRILSRALLEPRPRPAGQISPKSAKPFRLQVT